MAEASPVAPAPVAPPPTPPAEKPVEAKAAEKPVEKPAEKPADTTYRSAYQLSLASVYTTGPGSGIDRTHTAVSGHIGLIKEASSVLDVVFSLNALLYFPSKQNTPGVETFAAVEIQGGVRSRWTRLLELPGGREFLGPFALIGIGSYFGNGSRVDDQPTFLNGGVSAEAGVEFFSLGGKKGSTRVSIPISMKGVWGFYGMRFNELMVGVRID